MSGLQVNKLLQRIRSGWHKDGILWRFNACGKNEASGFWINWSCRTSGMFSGSTDHLLSPPNPQKFKVYLPGEKPTARVDKRKCGEGDGCAVCVCVVGGCWCFVILLFCFYFIFFGLRNYTTQGVGRIFYINLCIYLYITYIYISYIRWFRWAWFTTAPNFAHTFVEQCVLYNISFNGWLVG